MFGNEQRNRLYEPCRLRWRHGKGWSPTGSAYDGDWKRTKKTVGSARTEYYYDDMQLAETRINGVASEQFVYDTRYLHSVALRDRDTDGDGDCADADGSERLFYCNDGNFNVTALVATNGTVVERYTYDPYGKVTIRDADWQPITWDNSQKNVCLYTGHKYDTESGLYYSLYRYYHPGLGRWAGRDPIQTVRFIQHRRTGDNYKEVNCSGTLLPVTIGFTYYYVKGRPLHMVDSSGLESNPWVPQLPPAMPDPNPKPKPPKPPAIEIPCPAGYIGQLTCEATDQWFDLWRAIHFAPQLTSCGETYYVDHSGFTTECKLCKGTLTWTHEQGFLRRCFGWCEKKDCKDPLSEGVWMDYMEWFGKVIGGRQEEAVLPLCRIAEDLPIITIAP